MDSYIRKLVKDAYSIEPCSIEKIKNVYKLQCVDKSYCLKVINYNFGHFLFILAAIKHLQNNGFDRIPEIINTTGGESYIEFQGRYAYMTEWLSCRQCNYDNPLDLGIAASKLAELHLKSQGFCIERGMEPRIGWLKWIDTFSVRIEEIYDFKRRILAKDRKSEFDKLYLEQMDDLLDTARNSIINLCNTNYINQMKKEINKGGFCHHDYAHHNILIDEKGTTNIIDFDYCILDTHLHDLSSLIIRRMKNSRWDINCAVYIMNSYDSIMEIKNIEIPIMAGFMEFPQEYWQLGIQYYWENKDWGEEVFLSKLHKIYEDRDEKYDFIQDFKRIIL